MDVFRRLAAYLAAQFKARIPARFRSVFAPPTLYVQPSNRYVRGIFGEPEHWVDYGLPGAYNTASPQGAPAPAADVATPVSTHRAA